ncbi:hypothetical protein [Paracoccus indicus]|uniref:hypothetical protein n=1 Tax=Paracoccus indicus TaxID=2079229 RepID=UPI000D3522CC|nr:hypothetical protein [Paracoccus indicus]
MKTVIEAALVGDSHASVMIKSGEARGLEFRRAIAAAAPNFIGAEFTTAQDGRTRFQISSLRQDEALFGAERTERFARKAAKLDVLFRQAFDLRLPIYANVGMTAIHFVRDLTTAAQANGQDGTLISARIARAAARDYIAGYLRFYGTLVRMAPQVTCVFGPTRFLPENRHIWMAYDQVMAGHLADMGIRILDLRSAFGGDDLLLDRRYYKDPGDDLVHANDRWGLEVVQAIRKDLAEAAQSMATDHI